MLLECVVLEIQLILMDCRTVKRVTSSFLAPRPSWRLLLVGGVLNLRQEDGGCKEDEKVTGVDQL